MRLYRAAFLRSLESDVDWLRGHNIMDYSLLVGVASDEAELKSLLSQITTLPEIKKKRVQYLMRVSQGQ